MSRRAIEGDFPFEHVSEVAEAESWRKELYRPIYHMHKWWARRLGSVFRAAILGALCPEGAEIMRLFYSPVDKPGDPVIFDPFMGSGTTIGEAHKLGCAAIGRDINPVAYRLVKTALSRVSRQKLLDAFDSLEKDIRQDILGLYQSKDEQGRRIDMLYCFWVKVLPCPACRQSVDLFSDYVFAKHTYPRKHPLARLLCPDCGQVFEGRYDANFLECPDCGYGFDPNSGPATRAHANCPHCRHCFAIAKTARDRGYPPDHRMYAKLVALPGGRKEYQRITAADIECYKSAQTRLKSLNPPLPRVRIQPGYNTRQVLNYGYQYWHQMFNDRQLLALSLLAQGIGELPDCPEKEVLMLLFSGVLEFNNMFASYKGEGTGAVRHMFAHHILKPERTPIEANVWGTPKSSGAFSTLFRSRILRALEYKEMPFEIRVNPSGGGNRSQKVYGLSPPIGARIRDQYPRQGLLPGELYLSCGSSARTDIPDQSVDAVVTDPPFFDNVHYAELADFFQVWQRLYFKGAPERRRESTRDPQQVQDSDPKAFSDKLHQVFLECHRVLKDGGLLVFSYHHSREDGWFSVAEAVLNAGFGFVQSQPVKSEMSVAAPKSQAKVPIDIDVLLVCKKQSQEYRPFDRIQTARNQAAEITRNRVARFNRLGRLLSANDVKVMLYSQILVALSPGRKPAAVLADFKAAVAQSTEIVERINTEQSLVSEQEPERVQLALF